MELFKGKSLLQLTVARKKDIIDEVIVVKNVDNCHLSKKVMDKFQTPYINSVETTPRNTTAAIAFAAFSAQPDDILIVTPSDLLLML